MLWNVTWNITHKQKFHGINIATHSEIKNEQCTQYFVKQYQYVKMHREKSFNTVRKTLNSIDKGKRIRLTRKVLIQNTMHGHKWHSMRNAL